MSEFHPRDLTCPLCSTAFVGWLVLPRPTPGPTSSDLRRFPEGEDPLARSVNGCPRCAYTGEVSAFEEHAPSGTRGVPPQDTGVFFDEEAWLDAHDELVADRPTPEPSTLAEQLTLLAARAEQAHREAALRWEHHAHVTRWLGGGPLREGDCWLRAAWMHDDEQAEADAVRCRTRARGCYRRGLGEPRWFARREDLVVVGYLAGELARRAGDDDDAQRWFAQAQTWAEGLPRLEGLVDLARRQASDPREVV